MTDEPSESTLPNPDGVYWTCPACSCKVYRDQEYCPECGAYPDEVDIPQQEHGLNAIPALALLGILGGILFFLSRDAEAMRIQEVANYTRLSAPGDSIPGDTLPPQTEPVTEIDPDPFPEPVLPTPTPEPFLPEPFPEPVPTVPVATPVPATPTPIPPTPTPRPPSMLELRDQIRADMEAKLDETAPLAQVGDVLELTFRNGNKMSGTILRLDARQMRFNSESGQNHWIPYRALSQESRLRVDASERESFLEEQALQEVLKRM